VRWSWLGLVLLGCEASPSLFGPGLHLQLRVADAQLHSGRIRGGKGGPEVSQVLRPQPEVARGDATVKLNGRLAPDGVALHIQAVGDRDHWVLPAKGYDFVVGDELQYSATLEFSHAIQTDELVVRLAAADERGRLGPVTETTFTLLPDAPPARLLVSLGWDAPVDLDLYVEDPNGVVIGTKNVNALEPVPGVVVSPESAAAGAHLVVDANEGCRIDNLNREDVVWPLAPPPGRYRVYAHLFSPCDASFANMEVAAQLDGELLVRAGATQYAFDARNHPADGRAPGLLMATFDVP
jgi:hypothetical protein